MWHCVLVLSWLIAPASDGKTWTSFSNPELRGWIARSDYFENRIGAGEHQKLEVCFSPIEQSVTDAPHRDATFVPLDQQSAGYAFSTVLYERARLKRP